MSLVVAIAPYAVPAPNAVSVGMMSPCRAPCSAVLVMMFLSFVSAGMVRKGVGFVGVACIFACGVGL